MKFYPIFLFILFLNMFQPVWAGTENFFFTGLDIKDGLSQQTVTLVFQDADGYMWFGTRSGLNRYDGYDFKIYRKDYDDSHSLAGDYIMAVVQDKDRHIWVGTQQGLSRIDYKTEKIDRYPLGSKRPGDSYISAMWCTTDNRLLVFTRNEGYIYDREQDTFRLLVFPETNAPKYVTAVAEGKNGDFYLGTEKDGLWVCDKNFNLSRKLLNDTLDAASLPGGYVSFLSIDSNGRVWIVVGDKTGCYYDPETGRIVRMEELKNVRQIIEWNEHQMLAGTFHGLSLVDKQTLKAKPISMKIGEQGGLSHYSVVSLYKDTQKDLWVGTYSGGVDYYNKHNYRFNYVTTREFSGVIGMGAEAADGTLWFATEGGGLLSYNPRTHEQHNYLIHTNQDKIYSKNIIKSILLEGNFIYCATHGGEVYRFSIADKTYHLLYNFGYNDIYTLYRDSKERLWIPANTRDGLVVMLGNRRLDDLNVKRQYPKIGSISSILEIGENRFLIGTDRNGVSLLELEGERVKQISDVDFGFGEDHFVWVTSMLADSNGDIWIATNGAGLFQFDSHLKLKKRYFKENGLTDERVYCIMEKGNELWLMTSREIYLLNKQKGILNRFYTEGGIIAGEFSISAGMMARDGRLYLSGSKGFLTFDPALLNMNKETPPVLFTWLGLNNEKVDPGGDKSLLKSKLQLQGELVLQHDQTNLTIGYTALNYIYPEQNQYAYKMDGVDDKWNYVGNRREAFYNNLKPGEYIFRVKASNNDGIWNDNGVKLQILVLSPLWMRWWAWLIYVSLVVFLVYQIVFYRHRKHELERSLKLKLLEQEKLEELGQERTRFFTHVTHEFRTPLTLIINPLDELLQKYVHIAGVKDSLLLIRRNAQRLLSLVNSLMDIEKQQSGKAAMMLSNFDFSVFIHEIAHSFQTMAESRSIHFKAEITTESIPVRYDHEKLEQVFFNLLSNAFKFTPSEGRVTIHVCLLDEAGAVVKAGGRPLPVTAGRWLCVRVKDNGVGICPENADKIFEPFYQSGEDLHGQIVGSGIGLSLSKSIVEQHEGIIFAHPLKQGTEICVLIPYRFAPDMAIEDNYVLPEDLETEIASRKKDDENVLQTVFHKNYKILLVEDNAEVLDYLQKQLSAEYFVYIAVNGRKALEVAENELPDMVISDVMMPEMDGIELCRRIKTDIRLCHIPVILLTAKSMTMHIEEGFSAGADDYIAKPFSISLLKIRIRNIFASREQMKEIFSKKFSLESLGIEVESADQTFMDRYVEIVKNNFRNSNLDVDMICQEMGMSRANFYKKLKTITDLSPAEMIRNIRLESAARLLKETKLTMSEVAVQVGFSSNSYFGSCFKALYGLSPKEYQNTKE